MAYIVRSDEELHFIVVDFDQWTRWLYGEVKRLKVHGHGDTYTDAKAVASELNKQARMDAHGGIDPEDFPLCRAGHRQLPGSQIKAKNGRYVCGACYEEQGDPGRDRSARYRKEPEVESA